MVDPHDLELLITTQPLTKQSNFSHLNKFILVRLSFYKEHLTIFLVSNSIFNHFFPYQKAYLCVFAFKSVGKSPITVEVTTQSCPVEHTCKRNQHQHT